MSDPKRRMGGRLFQQGHAGPLLPRPIVDDHGTLYPSVGACCRALGCNRPALYRAMRAQRPVGDLFLVWADPSLIQPMARVRPFRTKYGTRVFRTVEQAAKATGVPKTNIAHALSSGRMYAHGYDFVWASDEPQPWEATP